MPKSKDPIEAARNIFNQFLSKHDPDSITSKTEPEIKDPKKVEAGRKGGRVGGKARAKNLTAKKRSAIAKKAAGVRWKLRQS